MCTRVELFRETLAKNNKEGVPFLVKHFKGGWYRAIDISKDCDDITREVVVYKDIYDKTIYHRKLEEFIGTHPKSGFKNNYRLLFAYELLDNGINYSYLYQDIADYMKSREKENETS